MKLFLAVVGLMFLGCGPPHWAPLFDSDPEGTQYYGPEVNRTRLQTRWNFTIIFMEVPKSISRVAHIWVHTEPTWLAPDPENPGKTYKVAGQLMGHWIIVGSDLAALAHELAHLRDMELGGNKARLETEAEAHARWLEDGTRARLDAYDSINWDSVVQPLDGSADTNHPATE